MGRLFRARRHAPVAQAGCHARRHRPGIYRQPHRLPAEHLQGRVQHRCRHQAHLRARRVVGLERARAPRRAVIAPTRAARRRPPRCAPRVSTPGRSSTGRGPLQSTMLDSMPMRQAPPSSTSRSSPNSSTTCCAMVGLTRPKRLALGAATPATPCALRRDAAAHARPDAPGSAAPSVAWPPAAAVAPCRLARGTITVSGPGQNASIRRAATGGMRGGERHRGGAIGHVHDQRMVARPALGGEDLRDRRIVVGACARGRRPSRSAKATSSPAARRSAALSIAAGSCAVEAHRSPGSDAEQPRRPGAPPHRPPAGRRAGHRQVPHLAAAARLGLAVQVQVHAGQRQHARPSRARLGRSPPANHRSPSRLSITRRRVQARRDQRQRRPARAPAARTARRRRRRCCSGRSCAAAAPSRWRPACRPRARRTRRTARRRSRVDAAIARARVDGRRGDGRRHVGRRHLRDREDAVAVQVLLHRQVRPLAPSAPRATITLSSDASGSIRSSTQGTRPSALPGRGELGAVGDAHLALAVVAEARGLQDAGQQAAASSAASCSARSITACGAHGTPQRDEVRLLGGAVLADGDRSAGRGDPAPARRALPARRPARSRTRW